MISAAMILPTIAPIAILSSLDEPGADVGPEVAEDWDDEPLGNDPVKEVADNEVSDDVSDVMVDEVDGKVEEGVGVELGDVRPP